MLKSAKDNFLANAVTLVPLDRTGKLLSEDTSDWTGLLTSIAGLALLRIPLYGGMEHAIVGGLLVNSAIGRYAGFLSFLYFNPLTIDPSGRLTMVSTAAIGGANIAYKIHYYWKTSKFKLLVDPRPTANKLVVNGVTVDSMIVDANNTMMVDYKNRPLINLQRSEENGTLLFNGCPVVLLVNDEYQNFAGATLTHTPGGNFRDRWGISHRTSTPAAE